jgi:hypothetical protein
MKPIHLMLAAICIATGLLLHGYFVGRSLERFKKEDRYISVKGFAEREVKANFAVWSIKTRITTNEVTEGSKVIEGNKEKITAFLLSRGIKKEDIFPQNIQVTDKLAREYGEQYTSNYRYLVDLTIQIRTEDVDKVQQVSLLTDDLLKSGIILSGAQDYPPAIQYLYTGLNDIKPEMLKEATQNARAAAEEFTKESGVRLGNLRKASQGLFTILDRDAYLQGQAGDGGYYGSNTLDMYKKVRVVVSLEYSIE